MSKEVDAPTLTPIADLHVHKYKPPGPIKMWVVRWYDSRDTTGNMLCVQRIIAAPFMAALMTMTVLAQEGWLQLVMLTITLLFSTWAWLTDYWDGPLARYQQKMLCHALAIGFYTNDPLYTEEHERQYGWSERIKMRGITHAGQTIDPVADKLSYLASGAPLLFVAAYMACWEAFVATIVYEAILFGMRPLKSRFELDSKAAKGPGKIKVNVQWFSLLILLVVYIGVNNAWWSLSDETMTVTASILFLHIGLWQTGSLAAHLWGAWLSWDVKKAKQLVEEAKAAANSN